ncbi:ABC transporter substrate-binding protein [Chloroflexota bacterium]
MRKKFVWVVVSGLMALSLVMASCAPAVVEEKEEVIVEEEEEEEVELEEEVVAPTVEVPKYGGVLKVGHVRNITNFCLITGMPAGAYTTYETNEGLWIGDWARGPAGGYGTNETDWTPFALAGEFGAGCIAENWELPTKIEGETATIIFHIRQGVHWALNPASEASRLVGGRELTADDVVFSLKQSITLPQAYLYKVHPELRDAKITSPEPWTVKIEIPWEGFMTARDRFGDWHKIVPPEVIAEYGTMTNWKVSVGTGPFMLTDMIQGSTVTLMRNPNYWMKDPIGPGKGNQLPYIDGVKYVIIPDKSTMYAALRTAKVDWLSSGGAGFGVEIPMEELVELKKTTPQLMSSKLALADVGSIIAMNLDKEPFNDIRVRRALMMATDFETIKRDLYGGEAQIVIFPIPRAPAYEAAYYGPDEQGQWPPDCPESIKELYTYNPEKARSLLAEAGHPDGFKTNIICSGTFGDEVDYFSVIKDMWAKVDVDLELRLMESGAFTTMRHKRDFDQMASTYRPKVTQAFMMVNIYGEGMDNQSRIDDPVVNEAYPKIQAAAITNVAEANRLHKELMKYVLDQAWAIPKVNPYVYDVWWPWLKNYSGEVHVGYHTYFFQWVWLDQELKKSMGY